MNIHFLLNLAWSFPPAAWQWWGGSIAALCPGTLKADDVRISLSIAPVIVQCIFIHARHRRELELMCQSASPIKAQSSPRAVPGQPFCLHYLFPSAALNSSFHNITPSKQPSPPWRGVPSPSLPFSGDFNEICSCLLIKNKANLHRDKKGRWSLTPP